MELTEVVKIMIELIVAVASLWLVPWIKAKLSAEEIADMLRWVEIAVSAAEQLYDATQGSVKKKYVVSFLEERGYHVDETEMNLMIEAAVLKLHRGLTE